MRVRREFQSSEDYGAAVTPRRVLGADRRQLRSAFGFFTALILTLGVTNIAAQSLPSSQQIQGDFNGDRRLDVLLQPADATALVRIILADSAGSLSIPGQTWSADYLGLHWSADDSQLVIGDFTGDGRSDVLLQPLQSGGTGAVLLADPNGQFHAVTQLITNPYMGLDWSGASHTLVVGDFNGSGRDEVLLQTTTPGGMNMVAQPNAQGFFNTTGQSWPDGYLGLQWSVQVVTLYTGDFTGNGQSDLLVQVNDPVSDTQVPAYALLLAGANGEFTHISQSWGTNAFSADWSPATHVLSIQDVTGSGVDAIVLMAKDPNGMNYLFLGNQTGTFSKPDLVWTGTQTPKAAWAAKMASQASISVTATTGSSSAKAQSASTPQAHAAAAPHTQTPNAVGDMGGQSGVNGGAATYTIPIAVPPGRAGMQPGLSLNYSSRGGNGDLGMGWSVSGLSAITRCPATKAQDNYTQGVTYSATYDRLCLDGQHLIVVTGAYGSSGSVYRTELDSLVRITLTGGSINSSAASFKVDYEDGRKAYYGTSAGTNTQFIASGASYPLVWAIAQELDASGNNSIVYNYSAYGSGEYHIASIVYSGTANRQVDFTYTSRNDPSSVWLAGGLTRQTRLLSQLTTKVAGTTVRQYSLSYAISQTTGRSLLQSVQECGYAPGSGSLSCLPPDAFTWQNPALSYAAPKKLGVPSGIGIESGVDSSGPGAGGQQSFVSIDKDYDGDGQHELYYRNLFSGAADIFWVNNPNIYIDAKRFFSYGFNDIDEDFLSNGLADPIGSQGTQVAVAWCRNQTVCTNYNDFTVTPAAISYVNASIATGQFTGDGLPDIAVDKTVSSTSHAIYLYPNISTNPGGAPVFDTTHGINLGPLASFSCFPMGTTWSTCYQGFSVIGDLDGNGIPDLLITGSAASPEDVSVPADVALIHNTTGTAGGTTATIESLSGIGITYNFNATGTIYYFADINGDGLKDFVFDGADGNWQYQINQGGHFGPVVDTGMFAGNVAPSFVGFITNFGSIKVGDFTNEGKDELLVPVSRISTYCLILTVKQEGAWVPEPVCGDDLDNKGYLWADHSIYNFQILKFIEQPNGTYAPGWVSNSGTPVSVAAEGGTVDVGDIYGKGLTDIFMLSSRWFNNGRFNIFPEDGCAANGSPPCAPRPANGYYTISPNGGAPDLMTGATNGLGAQASWTYDSLTDLKQTGAYKVDRPCSTAPGQFCFASSMYVVSDYRSSNAIGGMNDSSYAYENAIYNSAGRGFQGFQTITETFAPENDADDIITTVRTYNNSQAFPLSGALSDEKVYKGTSTAGTLLSETSNTWKSINPTGCLPSTKVYWPQLTQSIVTKNGTGGEHISTTTTGYTYDGNGNTTQVAASTVDSSGTYGTTTSYLNNSPDCTNWWLNKFSKKTLASSVSYASPIVSQPTAITRTANYTYTSLRKILAEQVDQGTAFEKDTTYAYDSYGNATNVTVSSPVTGISAIVTRTVSTDYSGTNGYFADSIINAAGQATLINPDPNTGQPLTVTDPNLVVTTYNYDAFRRKISEQVTAPINLPATTISYQAPAAVCQPGSVYSVITAKSGYPGRTVCNNLLNHVLRTATDGFASGDPSVVDTQYDSLGRVTQTSEPYNNEQTTVYWNKVNQYDALNRVVSKTDAEGVDTAYTYSGLTATAVTTPHDSPAFTTVTITNSLGKLLSTVDANGSDTEFRYDVQGNPILIQDTAVHQTLATYNTLGQKTAVTDPDMGHWTYVYDVLGNLVQQTDAKSQVISQVFDTLNRMNLRTQPEGATVWCYDGRILSGTGACTGSSAAPSVGKLTAVARYDGYQQTYSYDGDGRVVNVDERINGQHYATGTAYDSAGHVSQVAYPAGVTAAPPTISAGNNQTVAPGTLVTLNGSGTASGNGPLPLSFQWTELSGPSVILSNPTIATPTFTAGPAGSTYLFQLTDSDGLASATDTVTVSVPPLPAAPSGFVADGDTDHNGIYLVSWNTVAVPGQTITYHLEQATGNSSGPTSAFTEIWSGTAVSDSVNNSSNSSYYYYYRVRAQDISGYSGYSATAGIHVVVQPSPTPSLTPVFRTVPVNTSYNESWTTVGPKVTAYNLYEANDPSFSGQTLVYSGMATSKSFRKTGGDVDYYYRLQACNSSDGLTLCTAYSNTSHIYVAPGGGGKCQPPGTDCQPKTPQPKAGTAAPAAQTSAAAVMIPSAISTDPSGTGPLVGEGEAQAPSADISRPSLPSAGASRSEGDQSSPVSYSAARNTQYSAPSAFIAPSTQATPSSIPPLPLVGEGRGEGGIISIASRSTQRPVPSSSALPSSTWHYGPTVSEYYAGLHFEPAASTTTQVGLTVHYTYTSTGYLKQLSNAVYPSQIFWTANGRDAFGQIASETYGGGLISSAITHNDPLGRITGIQSGSLQNLSYSWSKLGNLTYRSDSLSTGIVSESFGYDILNRLTSAQVTNPGGVQSQLTYAYDALGNITGKSDMGSYTYVAGRPHAVTSISGSNPGTYAYDADGNMTNRNGTVIAWNSDNLPISITQSSSNASSFSYAPDKHRYYQSAVSNGVTETTVYAGVFEAVTTGGTTKYRYHLSADSREVAEVDSWNSGSTVNETVSYVLSDHLGSVDVVRAVNASNGTVVSTQYMSFSAWGGRRAPTTWLPPVSSAEAQADHNADRYGFTHQEMLDNVGIIHMNGRIYDPNLGRFLSVDPVFEFPTNTQSLNPYSYVLNNPLSMTDPTGYATKTECGKDGTSPCEASTDTGTGTRIKGNQDPFTHSIAGNGAITRQESADAQHKPNGPSDINSPSTVSKAAAASNCAYGDSSCKLPDGMHAASADWLKQHGIKQSDLQNSNSGFSASIYIDSQTGQIFVAFRGTEITSIKDLKTDAGNADGKVTLQYKEAKNLGYVVATNVQVPVIFTGHSLGGGLASVAALRASMPAVTFNAAGVSESVLHNLGLSSANANRLIQAYRLNGDPVTRWQTYTPLPAALGTPHALVPTAVDAMKSLYNPLGLHSMHAVLDSLSGGN